MTIDQIWETSRHNDYSWMLPAVLGIGATILILMNGIRKPSARRVLKILFALGLTYLTLHASSAAITEKWRIRHDWGKQNGDTLTNEEQNALYADGANLVMGPFLYGGVYSFWLFGGILVTSAVIRKRIQRKHPNHGMKGIDAEHVKS